MCGSTHVYFLHAGSCTMELAVQRVPAKGPTGKQECAAASSPTDHGAGASGRHVAAPTGVGQPGASNQRAALEQLGVGRIITRARAEGVPEDIIDSLDRAQAIELLVQADASRSNRRLSIRTELGQIKGLAIETVLIVHPQLLNFIIPPTKDRIFCRGS